jgi:hypothetical protein
MRNKSLYGRVKPVGQSEIVINNFGGGVDEYTPPISIGDNQLSSGLDYISRDGVCLKHWKETDNTDKYTFSGSGVMVTWSGTSSGIFPMLASITTPFHATVLDGTAADYSLASYNFIALPETSGALEYITQAETYSVYWSTSMNILIIQAQTSKTLSTVTLPTNVYPRDVIANKTRLYLIDTHNTLWWSEAGDYTAWYGTTPSGEYVAEDSGYWFIDSHDSINRICSFKDNIYIYGDSSIYLFSGYSPETFSLNRMFVDIGTYGYTYRSLTKDANFMYFTYKSKVYAYDGSSNFPNLISEPVIANKNYVNGIASGVKPWNETYYTTASVLSVYADEDYLYWYPFYNPYVAGMNSGSVYPILMRIGVFDTKRKTWWKISGFSEAYNFLTSVHALVSHQYLFPAPEATGTYWGIGTHTTQTNAQTPYNRVRKLQPWISTEYFKTKAFAQRPSENMLLTDVYLTLRTTKYNGDADYQSGRVDVQLVEANMDTTFDDVLNTLYFKTYQLYGMQDFNSGWDYSDYQNMFITLHIPVENRMNIMYQNMGDGDEQITDGMFDTYQSTGTSAPAFLPTPYIKLMVRFYTDKDFELHRMELKYRVKGASR